MQIQDDTEALRQMYNTLLPDAGDIESMHQAKLDADAALLLMANPKAALRAMNVPVSDASVVNVSMRNRALRGQALPGTDESRRIVRIIVIVIHYRNCDSDVIIIGLPD